MTALPPDGFYVVGGTLRPDAPSYVERPADRELYERLRSGDLCYVLTPRQMGKSSLMARTVERLRAGGEISAATVDLSQIGTQRDSGAAERWYYGVVHAIARDLRIEGGLKAWWKDRNELPPLQRLTEFFSERVLRALRGPVVIFIDEIDSTIPLPFAGDFFAALRACFNDRSLKPELRRLTFVLLGVASPSDLIADRKRTPFNVGHRIELEDFSLDEARPLTLALPAVDEIRERILNRVWFWTNGHPYLTQRTLASLAAIPASLSDALAVDDVVRGLFVEPAPNMTDVNIAGVRKFLAEEVGAADEARLLIRKILRRDVVEDDPSAIKSALKLSGVIKATPSGDLIVRNKIYELLLNEWMGGPVPPFVPPPVTHEPKRGVATAQYKTAKIVLLGDSGVGKSGLAWRLAHGNFREHSATHGQQFWVLDQLRETRSDGIESEAVLWDLAGQPDYRLIHSLFLDNTDLALVVFDATQRDEPLRGVEYWLRQLKALRKSDSRSGKEPRTILVGARSDRGASALSREELRSFCEQHEIDGFVTTSARESEGLSELQQMMQDLIPWDQKPVTVTSKLFKQIRARVLELKNRAEGRSVILTTAELRRRIKTEDAESSFTDEELLAVIHHLANHGYVSLLPMPSGAARILLTPELLNNVASSIVLEARRNPRGLGAIDEQQLLSGGYSFLELKRLRAADRDALLESAVSLFLSHDICFRDRDPLTSRSYLVFPELINLQTPPLVDTLTEDGPAYSVTGAVENVFASLVVLLGYTDSFTRTAQWRYNARYEVGNGLVCGFRQEQDHEGELEFVLYFNLDVGPTVRMLFQSLFEAFLSRRHLVVRRFDPVICPNGHRIDRAVVRARSSAHKDSVFCSQCGARAAIPKTDVPLQLTREQAAELEVQQHVADQRSRFEQAIFRLKAYINERSIAAPSCFISYAWGNPLHERWVERNLATDLLKGGIDVVLDRWETARIGSSLARFIDRVSRCDYVIVVGTAEYRSKYERREPERGLIAERDLIGDRLISGEARKETVLPVLLEGTAESAFPTALQARVYADFRIAEEYFGTAFDVILTLYQISARDPMVADLRESLRR